MLSKDTEAGLMVDEKQTLQDSTTQANWLTRFLRHFRVGRSDVIAAQVGESAQNIIVGKNIIQIGTLQIPIWAMSALVISSVIGVAVVLYNTSALWQISGAVRAPVRMSDGNLNIAVAEFIVKDKGVLPSDNDLSTKQAQRVANFISNHVADLREIFSVTVDIWGPDKGIEPVELTEVDLKAEELNADVLIYGELHQIADDTWQLKPGFYLSKRHPAIQHADELSGEYALGTPIEFQPGNLVSEGILNEKLHSRLEALLQILRGLLFYVPGPTNDFQEAALVFREIAESTTWGTTEAEAGKEILYLFLGNAYLRSSAYYELGSEARAEVLEQSRLAYERAISLNRDYARSYNGLGETQFQIAQISPFGECDWEWQQVEEAIQAYQHALEASVKPYSGNVDLRANWGLGRSHYYLGLCRSEDIFPAAWKQAKDYHHQVLAEYDTTPLAHLHKIAIVSYIDLARIARQQAEWLIAIDQENQRTIALAKEAVDHYYSALKLYYVQKTEEFSAVTEIVIPLMNTLCFIDRVDEAQTVLNDFILDSGGLDELRREILMLTKEQCTHESKS